MRLPRFLDCAYALLFEEYQRLGLNIVDASERLEEWRRERVAEAVNAVATPDEDAVARQNVRSLIELQAAMQSVGGMPG